MIYLQASRAFASVGQLLRNCDGETTHELQEQIGLINFEIRHRLVISEEKRIPWATRLNEAEMQIFNHFCDWVDQKTGQPQHIKHLRMRIVSVNRMLATLRDKIPNGLISLVQLEFFAGVTTIHRQLENFGVENGLANMKTALFPEEADLPLAEFIDKMDALGVCLG
jgi:hypothetical protein